MRRVLLALVLFMLSPIPVYASTLEVGPGYQYTEIKEAIMDADPGSRILVYPGVYEGNFTIDKPDIRLESVNGDVLINGSLNPVNGITVTADNVTVRGLNVTGFVYGIKLYTSSYSLVEDNFVYGCIKPGRYGGDGILLWLRCHNNTVRNNIVFDCDRHGITLGYTRGAGTCTGNQITDNILYDNGIGWKYDSGIRLRHADYNIIKNNVIYMNKSLRPPVGIYLRDNCDNNYIAYNTINHHNYGIHLYSYCRNNTIQCNTFTDILNPTIIGGLNCTGNILLDCPTVGGTIYRTPTRNQLETITILLLGIALLYKTVSMNK